MSPSPTVLLVAYKHKWLAGSGCVYLVLIDVAVWTLTSLYFNHRAIKNQDSRLSFRKQQPYPSTFDIHKHVYVIQTSLWNHFITFKQRSKCCTMYREMNPCEWQFSFVCLSAVVGWDWCQFGCGVFCFGYQESALQLCINFKHLKTGSYVDVSGVVAWSHDILSGGQLTNQNVNATTLACQT